MISHADTITVVSVEPECRAGCEGGALHGRGDHRIDPDAGRRQQNCAQEYGPMARDSEGRTRRQDRLESLAPQPPRRQTNSCSSPTVAKVIGHLKPAAGRHADVDGFAEVRRGLCRSLSMFPAGLVPKR